MPQIFAEDEGLYVLKGLIVWVGCQVTRSSGALLNNKGVILTESSNFRSCNNYLGTMNTRRSGYFPFLFLCKKNTEELYDILLHLIFASIKPDSSDNRRGHKMHSTP